MSTPEQIVADDQVVTLAYVMRLDDGQEIGRSPESEPLEYLQGQGEILPGLETALYGMEIGEEKHIEVQAADAYGEYDREDFADLPRASFPDDLELVVGEALMAIGNVFTEVAPLFVMCDPLDIGTVTKTGMNSRPSSPRSVLKRSSLISITRWPAAPCISTSR